MNERLRNTALDYAKRGWPVLPLCWPVEGKCGCGKGHEDREIGKAPLTTRGLLEATTTPSIITAWWTQWPQANIGLAMGARSGLVAADVDTKNDGIAHWRELQDMHDPVDTLTSITGGGGQHYIFSTRLALRSTTGQISQGIDTRAEGGYIVAPPSLHLSGARYEWENKRPPANPPDWLLHLWPVHQPQNVHSNGSSPVTATEHEQWVSAALADGAAEGQRNATATRLAGYLRGKGHPRDVILNMLQTFAERCRPPLQIPELERIVNSVQRYQIQVQQAGISNPPEMTTRAGSLIYTWPQPGISINLEQIYTNKLGIHATTTINALEEGKSKRLHGPVNYNLLSTTGRESLIKYLRTRMEIDWAELLETLTDLAKAHLEAGEPIGNLLEYMNRPTTKWALWPFILDDQPTILFGPGGVGKSLFAITAMLTLDTGYPFLSGLTPQPGHHGLYLDWESTKYEHGERIRNLLHGAGQTLDPSFEVLHLTCTGPIGAVVSQIKRQIDDRGVTYIVVDSAGLACGNEPNEANAALSFFDAIRQLGVPSLIIAHQTKADSRGMPLGSVFWHNSARSTWEIRQQQEAGEDRLIIGLFHRKCNVGRRERPMGFSFSFGPDGATCIDRVDVRDVPEFAQSTPLSDRLAGVLRRGAMTVKQLAEELDAKENSVARTLKRKPGQFQIVGLNFGEQSWGVIDTK